ncbi:hypothetical protein PoB_003841700 [Plakobranchus ocellatus]|uniref:Uncharacterized protein n=1 Tax=Plakobranchus ocellatus TaxID=259542 RepID=A0AAV4AYB5_9GAST|nr:hypothetical protein PoB_003841700 [Plakobranchus ocellatus]
MEGDSVPRNNVFLRHSFCLSQAITRAAGQLVNGAVSGKFRGHFVSNRSWKVASGKKRKAWEIPIALDRLPKQKQTFMQKLICQSALDESREKAIHI